MELKFKRFNKEATLPKKHLDALAYDFFLPQDIEVPAKVTGYKIPTGIGMQAPKGFGGVIEARSSTNVKSKIRVCTGLIDNDYTGEINVVVDNLANVNYVIEKGTKIAQMYIKRVYDFEVVEVDEFEETERGDKGFGSSGR